MMRGLLGLAQRRLRYQVALGVGLAFAAMSTLFALLILNVIGHSTEFTRAERLKLARTAAASIDALVDQAARQLSGLAGTEAAHRALATGRADALEPGYRLIGAYNEMAVLSGDGGGSWLGTAAPPVRQLRQHPFVRRALETGAPSLGLVDITAFEHPPVVAVAAPVVGGAGRPAGVLVGLLHLAHGWQAPVVSLPPGSTTAVTAVVDERGMILARSGGPPPVEAEQAEPVKLDPHAATLRPMLRVGTPSVGIHTNPDGEHLVAFAPLRGVPAGVVVEEREDVALVVPNRLRRTFVLFGIVALVATSAAAWLHARYVTRPLEGLERAMGRVAAAALDEPVAVTRRDEIGMLATSFETMRRQLKDAMDARDRWEQELEARVRERTEEVRRLLARIIHAQEEERRRMARELHDDTAQSIATLLVHLGTLREILPPGQSPAHAVLERTLTQGAAALADLRRVIADLRPTALDDLGLIPALRVCAEDRLAAEGVKLDFRVTGDVRRLDPPVETAVFRILQEAVSNVARHARARTASIELAFGPATLVATVRDDGRGFTAGTGGREPGAGAGLEGMRERADLLRARLDITSGPGTRTTVRLEVPLEEKDG